MKTTKSKTLSWGTIVAATAAAASSLVLIPGAADASTAAQPLTYFGGEAYGSSVGFGPTLHSGKTAHVPLCTGKTGTTRSLHYGALDLPGLGTVGAVTNTVSSNTSDTAISSVSTSTTAGTTLLGGLIQADAITAGARQSLRPDGTFDTGTGASFVDLTVAGLPMPLHATRDETIAIPRVGSVTFNHQSDASRYGTHGVAVTALSVTVDVGNNLGLPSGVINVGRAVATLHPATVENAYGAAFGTAVQVGSALTSGRTAPVGLGCGGSGGETIGNATMGLSVPAVLDTGVTRSTVRSVDSNDGTTTSTSRSQIADVSLLNGAIAINALTARAQVTRGNREISRSSVGTEVVGLTINGRDIPTPTPNTTMRVAGLGTLSFGLEEPTYDGLRVTAVKLVLTSAQGSLPIGTVITVGSALAGVHA